MRGVLAALIGPIALASCGLPGFDCERDDQCTLAAQGVCQNEGRCSYPDPSCASGMRYSEHSGAVSGRCVGEAGGGTSPATADASGASSAALDPCADVDCGPQGTCEHDGGEPRCECALGFADQDLRCVEQDCPGNTCLWVDATDGDDADPGTDMDQPLRTLARAAELAAALAPGDAIMLHRGRAWDEAFVLDALAGQAELPIIIGAYGTPSDPPLIRGGVRIGSSSGVLARDLRITTDAGTGLVVSASRHVTVQRCEVFDATEGCVIINEGSEYTAMVDNAVWGCGEAVGIHGIALAGGAQPLGDHHWLLDNRIDAEGTTNALRVSSDGTDDIKVVGNYLRGSVDRGLHSRITAHGWLVGNVIAQAGDNNDAALDHAGAGRVIIRGNVIIDSVLPAVLNGRGEWSFNTILHRSDRPAITVPANAGPWSFEDTLILAGDAAVFDVSSPDDADLARNVYGPGCRFVSAGMDLDFAAWQAAGQDPGSRCEAVPGPTIPAEIGSTRGWDDQGLLNSAVPDPAWRGCAEPAGALDCAGQPRAAGLPPFDDIGHGWEGPPAVQERVEFIP